MTSLLTPIIKATNNQSKEVKSFYNMSDYENWIDEITNKNQWKIKYYKGLGTSTDEEAKDYFKNMRKITYKYTENSDEFINLAFNKKRADDRKEWLAKYDKNDVLDYKEETVNYETFINKDLIHFSNRNLERSIPNIMDGLKESTRKILFACFKRKLYTNEIKVAQLAGNVSEVTAYHHGENSLQEAIIGMAQIFVGTNNINLLSPNGQFGTRIQGGEDASSPRYIYTLLSKLTRLLFKEEDNAILNYLNDDGLSIEPDYYIPIIPTILINGAIGIGTGYSTNIPQFNPEEIIKIYLSIIGEIKEKLGNVINDSSISEAIGLIREKEIEEIKPYYLGFKGDIIKNDKGTYNSKGIYKWLDNSTMEITELPIGTWTENYKEFLEEQIVKNNPNLKSFESHYTVKNVKFILKMNDNARDILDDKTILNDFNLTSSKNLSLNNLHLFTVNGNIKKYGNVAEILKEWSYTRIMKYQERKNHQLKVMEDDYLVLSAKIRFIIDVIEGVIIIMNRKIKDVEEQMEKRDYYKYENSYDYLLRMPISQLTTEKKQQLEKEVEKLKTDIEKLKSTSIMDIWENELKELLEEWMKHKTFILEDYENDLKGVVKKQTRRKK